MTSQQTILISDLDGTYLEKSGLVPRQSRHFLSFLEANNIPFVIATSRSPHSVADLFRDIPPPLVAICSDGGVTISLSYGQWTVSHEILLQPMQSLSIINTFSRLIEPDECFIFFGSSKNFAISHYSTRSTASLNILRNVLGETRPLLPMNRSLPLEHEWIEHIRAISFFDIPSRIASAISLLESDPIPGVQVLTYPEIRFPSHHWLDITSTHTTKAHAVSRLLLVDSVIPHLIALGNGDNDIALFELADISICPEAAVTPVKELATMVVHTPCGGAFLDAVTAVLARNLPIRPEFHR